LLRKKTGTRTMLAESSGEARNLKRGLMARQSANPPQTLASHGDSKAVGVSPSDPTLFETQHKNVKSV
jgi:hypothetical protein